MLRRGRWLGLLALVLAACQSVSEPSPNHQWQTVAAVGQPTARHEASWVAHQGKLYLLGGRRINPVDVFDPKTHRWTARSPTPIELHHFQAVSYGDAIYIIGAMTGGYPNEQPVERVIAYYPDRDEFQQLHAIPAERRRGGAGAVVYQDKIYLVGGISNGHVDGYRPWLDEYDPKSGRWRALPDAPNARDHLQAAVLGDQLLAFAGRTSSQATDQVLELTVSHGNVFDFVTETWQPTTTAFAIPTQRAGNMVATWGDQLIIGGGESGQQVAAHSEVEGFDPVRQRWQRWPSLQQGRHGTGFAVIDDYLYTASGSGNRGGGPELVDIERLHLPSAQRVAQAITSSSYRAPVYQQWHTVTLSFEGPPSSETATPNPFTDYLLEVEFTHAQERKTVRGFYAADGRAADSGADSGTIWQARFTPNHTGWWAYQARLRSATDIALDPASKGAQSITLPASQGRFHVMPSDKAERDLRALGRLQVVDGRYLWSATQQPWLKGGANSPENFLAYAGFDGTYRIQAQQRDGESQTDADLHEFLPHRSDWRDGDPLWRGENQHQHGHGIVGAVNYLASTGMNAIYFLTMNIGGDGKDVWPYRDPSDFTRFDVSKLDQWERLFAHMQRQGIVLHMVTQETENERLLDGGDTGRHRQLYYAELIARFGHHLGLIWNLGEENGPADWSPDAQDHAQRVAMAQFIDQHDPYQHPTVIHTHSNDPEQDAVLNPLLGLTAIDGLSMQVADPHRVNERIRTWRTRSKTAGQSWAITMDEVGPWQVGAAPDAIDPGHDTIRQHALWGSLLAGAGGVEWYIGAHNPTNDLTTEDWRGHATLWRQTRQALDFFQQWTRYWELQPMTLGLSPDNTYGATDANGTYVIYVPEGQPVQVMLPDPSASYSLHWFDPVGGGQLRAGDLPSRPANVQLALQPDPTQASGDSVALIRRLNES